MDTFTRKFKAGVTLLAGLLLASLLLVGCTQVAGNGVKAARPTPTATAQNSPTPALPLIVVQPGYNLVFQQQGDQATSITNHSIIGQFTASTLFVAHVLCSGTGSVEVSLGTGIDIKNACSTYTNYGDIEMPHAANTTYEITATITGPARWQVYIEVKS